MGPPRRVSRAASFALVQRAIDWQIAPFAGATTAVTLDAPVTWQLGIAGVLMATGVWPHLTERHEHEHTYQSQDGPEGRNPLS